ncbi:MAG: helix-turn-helix transcriptional regulator [Microbacterium sp.]|uniref:AraC family transcriptional regulator n=1 Tax=Microbacterium sp. TaxID=51671 RepID=UPI001DAD9091|nr:AraC family transcriptional regulator [Microbacterium sp.]MBW8763408.1 helix-turn-helix transcriptional regulator [Microbacterium sp.]
MRFTSRDVDRVQSTWRQFVPSATLQNVDPRRFRFSWRSAQLRSATVVRYDLAAQVRSVAAPEDQLLACRVDAPDGRVWSGQNDLDVTLPWITDGRPVQASWNRGATVTALVFDRRDAQERIRQITGVDDLVLAATGTGPRSRGDARRWAQMVDYLDAVSDDDHGIVAAELERHALMMTLAAFGTTFDEHLHRRPAQRSGAPVTVRRALAYIEDNAHLPITVDDVAAASFISTRGLQYAFRRALDMTPAAALRRARLESARRELIAGVDGSIADVARRWGFSHPSRFAAAYRAAFGMSPSEAVRRAR